VDEHRSTYICDATRLRPNGGQIRSLDHAVELMYHPLASEIPTKRMCLEAIKDLFTYLPQSKANPEDAEVRTKLFIACYSSLFPFLYTGGVGLSHSIGHAIGATYSIPHGITSCLSLAPTVHFKASSPEEANQIARILPYIGKQSTGSDENDSHVVADAISGFVEQLGHKTTLAAVSCKSRAILSLLTKCSMMYRLVMPKKKLSHLERSTVKTTKTLRTVSGLVLDMCSS
jgi:alcohol dehydrogenase class IV